MTVGWRNPQEDAYDLTSINIWYAKNNSNVMYFCEDGYSNGSISTSYYNPTTFQDVFGRHNITIYEWTDKISQNIQPMYRPPEINDCQLISNTTS